MEKGLLALERAQATGEVEWEEEPEAPDGETGVELLRAIVQDKRQPLHLRVNCAKALLPFEVPKLAVTGYLRDDASFALALERAIARSREASGADRTLELTANVESAGEVSAAGKVPGWRRPVR
jgi:hypothetical protein